MDAVNPTEPGNILSAKTPLKLSADQLKAWEHNGYIVLKKLFSEAEVRALNTFIDKRWADRKKNKSQVPCDVYLKTDREQRIPFSEVDDTARHTPYKLNDLYLDYPEVRDVSLAPALCGVVSQLLSGAPIVINTLSIEYGTQQPDHIDTFFMPPRVENKMVASWVALEATHASNGPLRIYPGSHKIPAYRFSHGGLKAVRSEMDAFYSYIQEALALRKIEPEYFIAKPGDVLIWHAQLLHGGEQIADKQATRRSLVTHYFRARDQWPRFWQIKQHTKSGYYYKRPHQGTA